MDAKMRSDLRKLRAAAKRLKRSAPKTSEFLKAVVNRLEEHEREISDGRACRSCGRPYARSCGRPRTCRNCKEASHG